MANTKKKLLSRAINLAFFFFNAKENKLITSTIDSNLKMFG